MAYNKDPYPSTTRIVLGPEENTIWSRKKLTRNMKDKGSNPRLHTEDVDPAKVPRDCHAFPP